jgi:hypothetical protein
VIGVSSSDLAPIRGQQPLDLLAELPVRVDSDPYAVRLE